MGDEGRKKWGRWGTWLWFAGEGALGDELAIESPKGSLARSLGNDGKVAIDKRKLGMGNVEVEGRFDDGFVTDKVLEAHDGFDFP